MRVEIVVDTDLVKITNNAMLKHKSNLFEHVFTDQQCKFTTKCLYNIKKSKKKKKCYRRVQGVK